MQMKVDKPIEVIMLTLQAAGIDKVQNRTIIEGCITYRSIFCFQFS